MTQAEHIEHLQTCDTCARIQHYAQTTTLLARFTGMTGSQLVSASVVVAVDALIQAGASHNDIYLTFKYLLDSMLGEDVLSHNHEAKLEALLRNPVGGAQ